MSTKQYGIKSTEKSGPITFELFDDSDPPKALGTFRVSPRPRLDIVQTMSNAIQLIDGKRVHNVNILMYALGELLIKEEFVELARDPETNDPIMGWREADDRKRLVEIFESDRYSVPIETLSEIVDDMMNETTLHPTGASKAS